MFGQATRIHDLFDLIEQANQTNVVGPCVGDDAPTSPFLTGPSVGDDDLQAPPYQALGARRALVVFSFTAVPARGTASIPRGNDMQRRKQYTATLPNLFDLVEVRELGSLVSGPCIGDDVNQLRRASSWQRLGPSVGDDEVTPPAEP
jgi:hypothetical protein